MIYIYVLSLALILSLVYLLFFIRIKNKKKQSLNEVIPYSVGNKTIYLRRSEVEHFKSLSRKDQRGVVNRFEAKVKSGKIIPIREKGKIVGYIKKQK